MSDLTVNSAEGSQNRRSLLRKIALVPAVALAGLVIGGEGNAWQSVHGGSPDQAINANTFPSSGPVGIGTVIPDATLEVLSTTLNSTNNTAHFANPRIGPNHSHIHYGTTGDWYIRSASSTGSVIIQDTMTPTSTGSTSNGGHVSIGPKFVIDSAGYITIGDGANIFIHGDNGHTYIDGNGITSPSIISTGGKNFKIDHPLDPANKYLTHSCVESSDIKNMYDGITQLDMNGEAWVELPLWFEALNKDFRYQLTALGSPMSDLHVAHEISGNRFKIAGGNAGMKVSWMVTGIRQDAYAKAHPLQVEEDKSQAEQGHYLHPELYGEPKTKSVQTLRTMPQ